MNYSYKLGIIGAGNMAYAITAGAIKNGFLTSDSVLIADTNPKAFEKFSGIATGFNFVSDNVAMALCECENVLLAVKPQNFAQLSKSFDGKKLNNVISIMAGIQLADIKNHLDCNSAVRVMPNTPALVGEGMSVLTTSDKFTTKLFDCVGKTIVLDESKFDAVTAVSGSGPAYFLTFLQSLISAGESVGLSAEESTTLALQTYIGTAKLCNESEKSIDEQISAVKSKGGTTEAALDSFTKDKLAEIVQNAVFSAAERSQELRKN